MSTPVKAWRYVLRGKKGWAIVFMDSTGIFSAVSYWGSFGHWWSAHGHDDFRKFFLGKDFEKWPHYYAGKFRPVRVYDEEKTFQYIRERILEWRRDGTLSKEAARKEWDHFVEVACGQWAMDWKDVRSLSKEDFRTWYDGTGLADAGECAAYVEDPRAMGFVQAILPMLAEAIQAELAAETEDASAEDLADALDREHHAHEKTLQALVEATRELERLRAVETAGRAVLAVCDAPTTFEQQDDRLRQLGGALFSLRTAIQGELPVPSAETGIPNADAQARLEAQIAEVSRG